jgi:CspA family cold shock protein
MLTSHEFMIANKKRRNGNQSNRSEHQNGNGNHKPNHQKEGRGNYRNNKPGYPRHRAAHGSQQNFQQTRHQVDSDYVPQVEEGKVYSGIVQNYYREKGYGFIRCEDFEIPAFFHYSEIQLEGFKYLIKQQKVEFKARVSDEGKLQAYEVTPTELAPTQQRQIFNKTKDDSND